jgi:signal transduction histidine kinase
MSDASESELSATEIGFPVVDGDWCEVQFRHSDGSVRTAEMRVAPITWHDEPAHLAALRDITHRKKLEEQLGQAQKLEALGLLAAGIAHDFNNLTTVIIGGAQIILDANGEAETCREMADEIITAGERASNLTRQLRAFARRQVLRPKVLEMNALVADLAKMLSRLIGEHVRLEFIPAPEKCFIHADPGQIEQVLMNLAVNSRDVMPKGGKITIATSLVQLADDRFGPGVQPGPHVMLTVRDDGHGMDAATMSHIFDAFFTTKGGAKGTGLGLSTVYGIVKQSGGEIEVSSELGNGTVFRIYLPEVAETEDRGERKSTARASGEQPRGGPEEANDEESEWSNRNHGVLPARPGQAATGASLVHGRV